MDAVSSSSTATVYTQAPRAPMCEPQPLVCEQPTPRGDQVSAGVTSSRLHEGFRSFASSDGPQATSATGVKSSEIAAKDVKTTDDYAKFVGQLEKKYPNASGFDINRAVRQHFYSDEGTKNGMPVFDSWLGKDGGKNSPALKGIEKDLAGLPSRINNPDGKPVDLSHASVGIDAYYNQKTGRHGFMSAPLDAAKGVMLTHGGDLGQVFGGSLLAIGDKLGISNSGQTLSGSLGYASRDQLRGNNDGIAMGASMGQGDSLSGTLRSYYGP